MTSADFHQTNKNWVIKKPISIGLHMKLVGEKSTENVKLDHPNSGNTYLRACIISGGEVAESDVGEKAGERKKRASSQTPTNNGRDVFLLHSRSHSHRSTSQLKSATRTRGPPPTSSGARVSWSSKRQRAGEIY